ncbi:MAG: hypothetical protein KatS3mg110_3159 [Pirellulaceae bacterium]|nr:MAG: hypothetical protein KatS3mg110_3159 [Pirellulaceae bacterium]
MFRLLVLEQGAYLAGKDTVSFRQKQYCMAQDLRIVGKYLESLLETLDCNESYLYRDAAICGRPRFMQHGRMM